MGTRIDLTEMPAITTLLMEVSCITTIQPWKKVSWGSQQHKNKSGIEHSASLLKSVSLDATLALGQTSHFNIFNNGLDAQS